MTTPFVEYAYANGSANTVRPTSVTYPDGRVISQDYGTADGMNDAASRIASIVDDDMAATHLADYSYLGERSFVVSDSPEPQVKWTLASLTGSNDPDNGDIYSGLDCFGRVKDNRWYDYGASADADRIQYGYNRAGDRTWRQNTVADALSKPFDELYGNDLIHRLKELSRGILNGSKDAVTDQSYAECWSLDPTGNWQKYLEDTNGDGNWDLNQARTANTVNEITGISESAGPSWATPAYGAAGNMTTVPQPADPTKTYTATYDAWNRLVKLVDDDTSDTVAEYAYDGANRRILQKTYVGGVLDETRHLYYTQPSQWQVVEERIDSGTDAERQFIWGRRYVDDLVLRDLDTNGNGTLDERLYCLQDANWNVDAIIDTAGDVQERYAYSAYGTPLFLTSAFVPQAGSSFDWETLYAGYRWETAAELFHVRHRVFDSAIGTWCQRDPLWIRRQDQLYLYCLSRPNILRDPSGLLQAIGEFPYQVPGSTGMITIYAPVYKVTPADVANSAEFTADDIGRCFFYGMHGTSWVSCHGQYETFHICMRDIIQPGLARSCGCAHTDIYGSISGEVYVGYGGGITTPSGTGLPQGEGWRCIELTACESERAGAYYFTSKKFHWGPKAGQSCEGATSSDRLRCLQQRPAPPGAAGLTSNCQADVKAAAEECCLCTEFVPMTVQGIFDNPYASF